MRSSKIRHITLTAIIVAFLLGQLTYGATLENPAKTLYLESFDGIEAWKPFGLLSVEEPSNKAAKTVPLL